MKVGKIIDGYLHAIVIEESEKEQYLSHEWKLVDEIDNAPRLQCEDGYIIRVVPYESEDCIKYRYDKVFDTQKLKREIVQCKEELSSTDYQIIKCYEASLTGASMPYDVSALTSSRQNLRNRINEIEEEIASKSIL